MILAYIERAFVPLLVWTNSAAGGKKIKVDKIPRWLK